MKRLDVEPTEEAILDSIHKNTTGRNEDIVDFIKIISETEGPYTYMLDARWGEGKTFFLKSVETVINASNTSLSSGEETNPKLKPLIDKLEETDTSILPFYFNAWENDFVIDPITALFANMAVAFDRNEVLKQRNTTDCITSIVDSTLSLAQINVNITGLVKSFKGTDLIESYNARREIRNRINDLASKVIIEVANKLVIFIDELDRCRPDFAVKMLEQVKNLFNQDNVILVIATDSCQLAKAVGGVYGPGFNSSLFLERFFDERFTLSPINACSFALENEVLNDHYRTDRLIIELINDSTPTIRDAHRIKRKLRLARLYAEKKCIHTQNELLRFAIRTILPLLIFAERNDNDSYKAITKGTSFDALFKFGKKYPAFIEATICLLVELNKGSDVPVKPDIADCEIVIHDLSVILYGNTQSDIYRNAESVIGDGLYLPEEERRIFKQLNFKSWEEKHLNPQQ